MTTAPLRASRSSRLISAVVGWFFVIDLVSNGGNWTVVVTLVVGLAYLAVGSISRTPSSFWLHLVGGLLIGGRSFTGRTRRDGDWAVVSVVAFLFVAIAYVTKRSSWAVLGTIGFFAATIHYLVGSPTGQSPRDGLIAGTPAAARQPLVAGARLRAPRLLARPARPARPAPNGGCAAPRRRAA